MSQNRLISFTNSEAAMNHLLVFFVSFGFGVFAWVLLVVSDWLLADKPRPRAVQPSRQLESDPAGRFRTFVKNTFDKDAPARIAVPAARRAS
jgi:hypothetical protein